MMSTEELNVQTIHLLDKAYRISCGADEQEALVQSASYLDKKLREVQSGGRALGLDHVAIMTALNITHELITAQHKQPTKVATEQQQNVRELDKQLKFLQTKLEKAIERNRLTA